LLLLLVIGGFVSRVHALDAVTPVKSCTKMKKNIFPHNTSAHQQLKRISQFA